MVIFTELRKIDSALWGLRPRRNSPAKKLASARAERCEGAWQKHLRGPGRSSTLAAMEVTEAEDVNRGQTLEDLFIVLHC